MADSWWDKNPEDYARMIGASRSPTGEELDRIRYELELARAEQVEKEKLRRAIASDYRRRGIFTGGSYANDELMIDSTRGTWDGWDQSREEEAIRVQGRKLMERQRELERERIRERDNQRYMQRVADIQSFLNPATPSPSPKKEEAPEPPNRLGRLIKLEY